MNGTLAIHPKVVGGGLSGAVVLIALAVLAHFGIHPSGETDAAATLIVSAVGAYFSPLLEDEQPAQASTPPA